MLKEISVAWLSGLYDYLRMFTVKNGFIKAEIEEAFTDPVASL